MSLLKAQKSKDRKPSARCVSRTSQESKFPSEAPNRAPHNEGPDFRPEHLRPPQHSRSGGKRTRLWGQGRVPQNADTASRPGPSPKKSICPEKFPDPKAGNAETTIRPKGQGRACKPDPQVKLTPCPQTQQRTEDKAKPRAEKSQKPFSAMPLTTAESRTGHLDRKLPKQTWSKVLGTALAKTFPEDCPLRRKPSNNEPTEVGRT